MTMTTAVYFFAVPAATYLTLVAAGAVGFRRTGMAVPSRGGDGSLPSVSVVNPARNEEGAIRACIESVLANEYPDDRLEVIVVDDGSEDRTPVIVRQMAGRRRRAAAGYEPDETGLNAGGEILRLVNVSHDPDQRIAHKKEALRRGVEASRGRIILTTDADCRVEPTWIRAMVDRFDDDTGMVTGPVLYRRDGSFFGDVQALEFLGLVALGGGLAAVGRPHLCNSANLAYRREVYEEIGGYEELGHVSTGDDEMLMHRVAFDTSWKVRTCMQAEAVVETEANQSLKEFFQQRRRWASAHARYPHVHLVVISVLCYIFYVGLAGGLAAALFWPDVRGIVALSFVLKGAIEASLLVPASTRFERTALMRLFIPAQFLQIIYVLVIGVAGTFGSYEWKGRRVPR